MQIFSCCSTIDRSARIFFLCMCLVSKCTCSTPHLHSSVSPFCGILRIAYTTNLLFVHCLLRLENILRYQAMTNDQRIFQTFYWIYYGHHFWDATWKSAFNCKTKKLWDFCVKPSSFAFKSLQLHSSLLQFVNIGSDFHIWFSTTFLGHQNKTIQKTTRVWTTALLFSRHGNDLRHLFFWVKLGCQVRDPDLPGTTNGTSPLKRRNVAPRKWWFPVGWWFPIGISFPGVDFQGTI